MLPISVEISLLTLQFGDGKDLPGGMSKHGMRIADISSTVAVGNQ
jgi:hypothetical protein